MVDQRLARRLALRPGLRVFRRDDTHLQVGLDEPRVVLADTEGVRALLRALESGDRLGLLTPEAGLALARLADASLVVEVADLEAAQDDHHLVALAAHGPAASARLKARASCAVLVDSPEPWRSAAFDLLTSAGVATATAGVRPTVSLHISAGEPPRSRVDAMVRDDRPHLVVTLLPDRARVGPFVAPGSTACLRCVDAHLAEADPRRALVLEQLEGLTIPGPVDALLAAAALALAVRELVTYAEGDRPATWSATLTLDAELGQPARAWTRHPHCGCSWGEVSAASVDAASPPG